MASVSFVIRGKPCVQARHRHTNAGKFIRVYDPSAKDKDEIAMVVQRNAPEKLLEGPLKLLIQAWFPIPDSWSKKKKTEAMVGIVRPTGKRNDWDNVGKIYSDAMNGIIYHDDGQIVDGRIAKFYGDMPQVDIFVMEIEDESLA